MILGAAKLFKVARLWMWKMTSRDEERFPLTGPPCSFGPGPFFPPCFDVCSRSALRSCKGNPGHRRGISSLCSSRTVKPLGSRRKNTLKVDSSSALAPPGLYSCLLCAHATSHSGGGSSLSSPARRLVNMTDGRRSILCWLTPVRPSRRQVLHRDSPLAVKKT